MSENIRLGLDKILLAVSVLFTAAMLIFVQSSYTAPLVLTVLLLMWGSYYAIVSRKGTSPMCCMMSGMAFGMLSGFFVGTVVALITGDFLIGMIIGSVAGVLFGVPVGQVGGPLARMEGVMAGPMGGMMGAMTGVMVQFYNLQIFMPFLVVVMIFSVWEMTRVINAETKKIKRSFIYIGAVLSVLALASTFAITFVPASDTVNLGPKQLAGDGDFQEVTINIGALGYAPDAITVRKDVPVRLTLKADNSAGCTRDFVFSEFNIRKLVPRGGTEVVEFTPTQTGTFEFRCSMNMARGTLTVQ
jgi:hypothetical protein